MSHNEHERARSGLRVEEVMTACPVSCRPDTSLHEAAGLLWEHDIGALPVVNGTFGSQVSAMITDRDIAMAAYTQARPLHELFVRAACSGPARSCRPDDPVEQALASMAEAAVRRLVVVDAENHAVGMVSLSDIARAASSANAPASDRTHLARVTCQALSMITLPSQNARSKKENPPDAISHSRL